VRRLEHGEVGALEAIDILLSEELTLRENSRIKIALRMGRLATIKTIAGFDFSFQPSLDRDRILTLAQLGFVARHEVVHFLGPPGTGKSHLATALGVEAVKAGRSVYFCTLADLLGQLARAEREGRLLERIRFFARAALLIVDEIGYLPVVPGGGNLFFQLVSIRSTKGEDESPCRPISLYHSAPPCAVRPGSPGRAAQAASGRGSRGRQGQGRVASADRRAEHGACGCFAIDA